MILDHIIIGDNRYFSFAGEGLIEEYEMDYLNLKLRGTSEAKRRVYRAREVKKLRYNTGSPTRFKIED